MTPPKQFYDNNSKRHRRVIRRLRERFGQKREDPAFMAECRAAWDASITEVHAGTCQGPFTVSSIEKRYGYGRLRVIGRHVVHQGEKIRAVDDARATPGFEADDLIATMAEVVGPQRPVIIVSSDKDFMQLVQDDRCLMVCPQKRLLYDEAQVLTKLGVPPNLVVDLLALMGDSADNIPGKYNFHVIRKKKRTKMYSLRLFPRYTWNRS
jgi:hypothetical protein